MKKLGLLFMVVAAISIADLKCQEGSAVQLKGLTELSPAFSFSSVKDKGSKGDWFFTVPLRVNHFVSNYFGYGGEIVLTVFKVGENAGIAGNILFESDFPVSPGAYMYLVGGVGLSNTNAIVDRIAAKYDSEGPVFLVGNLGGGIKFPIGSRVLGKVEIRYQNFRGKETYEDFDGESTTTKIRTSYVNTLFGISVLL